MNKKLSLLLTLIVLGSIVVLLNCGSNTHPAPLQPPPQQPQTAFVAFMQEVEGQPNIFTPVLGKFTANGSNVQFTASSIIDPTTGKPVTGEFWSIALSKDAKKAVVDLYGGLDGTGHQWDIWIGSVADASMTQISNDAFADSMPQFSPDGTKIVYMSLRPISAVSTQKQWQIVIRNVDGTGEQLLPIPAHVEFQGFPAFSPDGALIVFEASGVDANDVPFYGVWTMNADGTSAQPLTNPLYSESCYNCRDYSPTFTTDGSKIVFGRFNGDTAVEDIYSMNLDGTNAMKLTDGVGLNSDPLAISIAKSDKLLFASNRDNLTLGVSGFEIYSMQADGTGLTRLTNNSLYDSFCAEWYEYGGSKAHTPLFRQHHSGQVHW